MSLGSEFKNSKVFILMILNTDKMFSVNSYNEFFSREESVVCTSCAMFLRCASLLAHTSEIKTCTIIVSSKYNFPLRFLHIGEDYSQILLGFILIFSQNINEFQKQVKTLESVNLLISKYRQAD